MKKQSLKIYLDYAASTPVLREVKRVMEPYFSDTFGNPGSLHSFGQEAIAAIDAARETIAKAIHAEFREVIFTSGATEANNLALRGVVFGTREWESGIRGRESGINLPAQACLRRQAGNKELGGRRKGSITRGFRPKVIVSAIEHESVLDTAYALEKDGVEVAVLPVDKRGIVDLKKLETMLDERTVLVSVMYVNNEIGSVQPISKISEVIRNFRNAKFQTLNAKSIAESTMLKAHQPTIRPFYIGHLDFGFAGEAYPLLHVDAAQAFEYFKCDVGRLGVDLMTLSSQKIYGPKGAGALFVKNQESGIKGQESGIRNKELGVKRDGAIIHNSKFLIPFVTGGGQEFGFRSGTENVPAIVGFGNAAMLAEKGRAKHAKQVTEVRNYFWRELKKIYPQASMNGDNELRIGNKESGIMAPHIINAYFPTEFAGDLLVKMDMAGIAASSGSACSARSFVPSHVLEALGLPSERIRGSIRFSFGVPTTRQEIREAVRRIKKLLGE